jgi:E3 ubiquitin-protein ligase HERC2
LRGAIEGERIVGVSAGYAHFLALGAGGAVYAWGHDEGTGKTGLLFLAGGAPRVGPVSEPTLVEALRGTRVVGVAAGYHHSCALTSAGELLTWGFGGFGALGHGDTHKQRTPKRVEALSGLRIVSVSTGATHTVAVGEDGAIFAWGAQNGRAAPVAAPASGDDGRRAAPTLPLLPRRIAGVCAQL